MSDGRTIITSCASGGTPRKLTGEPVVGEAHSAWPSSAITSWLNPASPAGAGTAGGGGIGLGAGGAGIGVASGVFAAGPPVLLFVLAGGAGPLSGVTGAEAPAILASP